MRRAKPLRLLANVGISRDGARTYVLIGLAVMHVHIFIMKNPNETRKRGCPMRWAHPLSHRGSDAGKTGGRTGSFRPFTFAIYFDSGSYSYSYAHRLTSYL